jgi:hypothetical protein
VGPRAGLEVCEKSKQRTYELIIFTRTIFVSFTLDSFETNPRPRYVAVDNRNESLNVVSVHCIPTHSAISRSKKEMNFPPMFCETSEVIKTIPLQ